VQVRFSTRTYVAVAVLATLLLTMAVVWTAVKPEYRRFISGGQAAQVVSVDFGERSKYLAELVSKLDSAALSDAADKLLRRLSYIDFFATTLNYVPSVVPHEWGAIWWDAIVRPFTPRLFFPDKSEIDDSVRTNKYTGLNFGTAETGVSISIGYMGEAYIDFGALGMMFVVGSYGYFLGRVYGYFTKSLHSRYLLGMGVASATIKGAMIFETSITKSLGGIILVALASWLLTRILIPKLAPWTMQA
jgi:hypothetical protein